MKKYEKLTQILTAVTRISIVLMKKIGYKYNKDFIQGGKYDD